LVEPVDKARLAQLEKRIAQMKGVQAPGRTIEDHHSQAHLAWRMVIELVTGMGMGFGIGYALDVLFGTLPLFLVLFILLGFAAGVRVMMRTAQEVHLDKAGDKPEADGAKDSGD